MKQQWEYKIVTLGSYANTWEKDLNQLGNDGWELVGPPDGLNAILKRPK